MKPFLRELSRRARALCGELRQHVAEPIRESAAWAHYGRCELSVRYCELAVEAARRELEQSILARDRALADVRAFERPPTVPLFLLRKDR